MQTCAEHSTGSQSQVTNHRHEFNLISILWFWIMFHEPINIKPTDRWLQFSVLTETLVLVLVPHGNSTTWIVVFQARCDTDVLDLQCFASVVYRDTRIQGLPAECWTVGRWSRLSTWHVSSFNAAAQCCGAIIKTTKKALVRRALLVRQRQQTLRQEDEGNNNNKLPSCVKNKSETVAAQAAINIPRSQLNCHRLFQVPWFFSPTTEEA